MSKDEIATKQFIEDAQKIIESARKCRNIKGITFHVCRNVDAFDAINELYIEKCKHDCELTNNGTDTITIKW